MQADIFCQRRERLRSKMRKQCPDPSFALVASQPFFPQDGDALHRYEADLDLLYLSGISDAGCILLLASESANEDILLIPRPNELTELWHGEGLKSNDAEKISGIGKIYYTDEFSQILRRTALRCNHIFLNYNEHLRLDDEARSLDGKKIFADKIRADLPLHNFFRLAPLLAELRLIKDAAEISAIKAAIDLTARGWEKILPLICDGANEAQIALELEFFWRQNGGDCAFAIISAAGKNGCALHYTANNQRLNSGECLLLDFGARLDFYNADITRVIPIGENSIGKFSARQQEIFTALEKTLDFAAQNACAGKKWSEFFEQSLLFIGEKLCQIGLLKNGDKDNLTAIKKYMPHNIGHSLGLGVHDAPSADFTLEAGCVFTLEPGIYLPDEQIGMRLEDDFVIDQNGNSQNLSIEIPRRI